MSLKEKKEDLRQDSELDDAALRKKLTPQQYCVTRQKGTEPPFLNKYWDNKEAGIYVDIITGEPLFSSKDKFDSGTGWPSFSRPIKKEALEEKIDSSHGMLRTEVAAKRSGAHLGHVFNPLPEIPGLWFNKLWFDKLTIRPEQAKRVEGLTIPQTIPSEVEGKPGDERGFDQRGREP